MSATDYNQGMKRTMRKASDFPRLFAWAKSGDIDACCSLADKLMSGGASGYRAAIPFLRKAASVSECWAEYSLGYMYDEGIGRRRNVGKAIYWYARAVQGGYPSAMCNLGVIYANLPGKRRDLKQAIRLYRRAARHGNRNAMYNLGLYYEKGRGLKRSAKKAAFWYEKASEKGHRTARSKLLRLKHT